jgi:hypothetical protein
MPEVNVTPAQAEAFEHEWCYHILPDSRAVTFSFCEATHLYRVKDPFDGRFIEPPSVTQLLDRAGLAMNYSAVPSRILERKRTIGAYVHKAAHYIQEDALDPQTVDPQIMPYLSGYLAFLKDSGFEVKWAERRIVGCWNSLWWAGTLDVDGIWEGNPWILDLKCTAALYPSHTIQTAGYELALPKPIKPPFHYNRGTLHLRPDGTYAAPKRHADPTDREVFLLALQLEWEKRRRGI